MQGNKTDIWRHMKNVASQIEALVQAAQRHCLIVGAPELRAQASSVEKDWSSYQGLSTSVEGMAHQEVSSLLMTHIQQLQIVLRHLEKMPIQAAAQLDVLRDQICNLKISVSNMKPGAGGGAFEWVDSLLVTALKNGHWLLVDNVNFCSASVLDRLNALLEPKGVLTINEKGTVDGEIVTVVPHPNFRLFFAMDPKMGEISRAMRNRGIEIYMLGETEGEPYSEEDILAMLTKCSGLKNEALCHWLLDLHRELKAEAPIADCPVLEDLLQAARVIAQLIKRGFDTKEAIVHATEDVYINHRKNGSTKKHAKSLVQKHLTKMSLPEDYAQKDQVMSLATICPGDTSILSTIKEEGKFILELLKDMQQNSSSEMSDTIFKTTQFNSAALIFASMQCENSWQLALAWLDSVSVSLARILKAQGNRLAIKENDESTARSSHSMECFMLEPAVHGFEYVRTLALGCLKLVFEGQLWPKLKSALAEAFTSVPQALCLINEQPWDLNQNPQASKKAFALLKLTPTWFAVFCFDKVPKRKSGAIGEGALKNRAAEKIPSLLTIDKTELIELASEPHKSANQSNLLAVSLVLALFTHTLDIMKKELTFISDIYIVSSIN
ncbi:midasin-like [Plakobranchus ocellatus]|uniref:Midasin-like n=1 Tax=Plakobranchus ocellatus TaxID=259542 RepID=A0AAV4ABH4_9GAST|nr:midasin-like [Plakobranchus ocellatus]